MDEWPVNQTFRLRLQVLEAQSAFRLYNLRHLFQSFFKLGSPRRGKITGFYLKFLNE